MLSKAKFGNAKNMFKDHIYFDEPGEDCLKKILIQKILQFFSLDFFILFKDIL